MLILPEKHVEELRQFVQRVAAQETANRSDPRIVARLEADALAIAHLQDSVAPFLGVDIHAAELQKLEGFAVLADTDLLEQRRTR